MLNNIDFNLISQALASDINKVLLGKPTENRIVLAVNPTERRSMGGLYIPDAAKEDIPKKGVVVAKGPCNEDLVHESIQIGDVVSYGMYGGKEIYPSMASEIEEAKDLKYYVLSSSEVIYIEPNTK